jgi:hypothetical protein
VESRFPCGDQAAEVDWGYLVDGAVACELRKLLRGVAVAWGVVRLGPRLADRGDGSEARAFFVAAAVCWRVLNFTAAFFVAKALRCLLPRSSLQSAYHFPALLCTGHLWDTRL